jgi:hypothetical protein
MKLSEAILYGRTLRPESHQEGHPFVRVVNGETTDLYSDVLGAAVEAVHSPIIKRDWTDASYQSDMACFVDVLHQHFGQYFRTAANCPGAKQRHYADAHARITSSRSGEYVVEHEGRQVVGAVTSDCRLILNLAQFVEHAFYIHNWSSEKCAEAVEYYEQGQSVLVAQSFDHYQDEGLRANISQRLTAVAWQRELQRRQRRTGNRVHVH